MAPSSSPPHLPLELHAQIIAYLSIDDQIRATEVCKSWSDIIINSRSMRKSRYSSDTIAKGMHRLISSRFQDQGFRCLTKGQHLRDREYYYQKDRLRHDNPCLDEPFFSPAAWNGEDPDLADYLSEIEFNLFTNVPGNARLIWKGTTEWGRDVTVRGFIEGLLQPVIDVPSELPQPIEGILKFFPAIKLVAAAYSTYSCKITSQPSA